MILADTDVLIDFLEGKGEADRVLAELGKESLATTTITRYELLAGAATEEQRNAIRQLLDCVTALPLDAAASDRAAEAWRLLESRGERIGMADCLIAGIALQHGVSLLTRNRQNFSRVPDLVLA